MAFQQMDVEEVSSQSLTVKLMVTPLCGCLENVEGFSTVNLNIILVDVEDTSNNQRQST